MSGFVSTQPRVRPHPVADVDRRVAVEQRRVDAGDPQPVQRTQLVGGQRLGRRDVEHGGARVGRQVASAPAAGRPSTFPTRYRSRARRADRRGPVRPPRPDGQNGSRTPRPRNASTTVGGAQAGQGACPAGRGGSTSRWVTGWLLSESVTRPSEATPAPATCFPQPRRSALRERIQVPRRRPRRAPPRPSAAPGRAAATAGRGRGGGSPLHHAYRHRQSPVGAVGTRCVGGVVSWVTVCCPTVSLRALAQGVGARRVGAPGAARHRIDQRRSGREPAQ